MSDLFDKTLRLTAQDLCCIRGERLVFSKLSFAVAGGELLAILGNNGAGKSSLLRQIAGLVGISAGTLSLEGGDRDKSIGEQAHVIGHLDALKPSLSVYENLAFWQTFYDEPWHDIDEALNGLGLQALAKLPVAYLSQGQKRRLTLARLLIAKRPLWLLDEPTAALDASTQNHLAGLMSDHLKHGGMILAATHGPLNPSPNITLELSSQ